MPLLNLRYDLRCPPFGKADSAELMRTAIEQCEWADRLGFASVTISEHHGSPDGYLPSPLVFGAGVATRTKNMRILLGALIVPLHDPVRLAEDIATLDVLSNGRVIAVLAGGYVESEFRTFGKQLSDRAKVMDEIIPFLERAWSGEPFQHNGVTVRVTPRPVQRPRPILFMGGATKVAARRAARFADHFMPTLPHLFDAFREERLRLGKPDPGAPPRTAGNFLYVAEDPDAAWERIAPHALHETNAYGKWMSESGTAGPYKPTDDPDALRASGQYPIMTPDEVVALAKGMGPLDALLFHPLMGGMDPELSWASLRLLEKAVLPRLTR